MNTRKKVDSKKANKKVDQKKVEKVDQKKVEDKLINISIDQFILSELESIDQKLEKVEKVDQKLSSKLENKLINELESKVFDLVKTIKLEQEKIELENHAQKIATLESIDQSLIADYLTLNNLSFNEDNFLIKVESSKDQNFKDSSSIAEKVFKKCKFTKTLNLAYELAKTSKTLENESLNFRFGNGFIEYFLFWHLINKPEKIKENFKLNKALQFTNKFLPLYTSPGHFNYLTGILQKHIK